MGISLVHTAEVGRSHRMSAAMSDEVVMEGNMVFNTIACWNTHLNGSVGVVNDELHFNGRLVGSFDDRYAPTAGVDAWKRATGFY